MTYADTSFLVSLYSRELTTVVAEEVIAKASLPIILTPLTLLEMRNAFNLAVKRREIIQTQRNRFWASLEEQIDLGYFEVRQVSLAEVCLRARDLSDRYTLTAGTRSLDLLHVAIALLLKVDLFLSFDERQRIAAKGEGLKVKP